MRISDWSSDVCSSDLAGLAEGDVFAGHVLQLDRHVLEHVTQPGALAFAHAADEAARFAVRAAVFGQARQRLDQGVDEGRPQLRGRPGFERAQVELRSEEHTSELQSLMRISYAVFCLKK